MIAVSYLIFVGSLVCFILVLVKMFQKGETTLGIVCLALILACGLGFLVTFIMGWVKVDKLQAKNIMLVWTVLFVLSIVMNFVAPIQIPGMPQPGA